MFTYNAGTTPDALDEHLEIVWGSRSEQEHEVLPISADDIAAGYAHVGRIGYLDATTSAVKFGTRAGVLPLWLYTSVGTAGGGLAGASGPSYGINMTNTVGSTFLSGVTPRVLRTQQFVSGAVYTVDAPLTVETTGADTGKLKLWTVNTQPIVGYVAKPLDLGKGELSGTANDCTFSLDKNFDGSRKWLQVRTAYVAAGTINA